MEALSVSLSKGLQITLLIGRGDNLGAETKTGAGTNTDPVED